MDALVDIIGWLFERVLEALWRSDHDGKSLERPRPRKISWLQKRP